MNKREKIQKIRNLICKPKAITLKYVDAENGKDIIVMGTYTQKQIDQINSGKVKIIEDLSRLSDEMLFRMKNGYQPKVYFAQ
jgi:hypothetical protein